MPTKAQLTEQLRNVTQERDAALLQRDQLQTQVDAFPGGLADVQDNLDDAREELREATEAYDELFERHEEMQGQFQQLLDLQKEMLQVSKTQDDEILRLRVGVSKTSSGRKLKAPETFNGTQDYRDWMRKVKMYLREAKITNDEEKIEAVLPYIEGDACKIVEE